MLESSVVQIYEIRTISVCFVQATIILCFEGVGAIVYWACGFAFAYGKVSHEDPVTGEWSYSSSNSFIGHTYFFLMDTDYYAHKVNGYPTRVVHNGSTYGEFFFNFVFAATATTIISGALGKVIDRKHMMRSIF